MSPLPASSDLDLDLDSETPTRCRICSSEESRFYTLGHDRLFEVAEGRYPLFRCLGCGCIYQYPVPGEAEIAGFYPREYWWSEDDPHSGGIPDFTRSLEKAYRNLVTSDHLRVLSRCVDPGASGKLSLLDIGCGSGSFLKLAQRKGFQSHGLDISERAVEVARSQYSLDVRQGGIGSSVWTGHRFDVVTMFHVLEHVPEPSQALSYASDLLRPGGWLLVQVPNVESLQARLFGESWYGLDVPRHLVNFTPGALTRLLESEGFRTVHVSHFSLRDNPAAIVSSFALSLDPIRRRIRAGSGRESLRLIGELMYAALLVIALPLALLESLLRRGGTIFVLAVKTTEAEKSLNGKTHPR